MADREGQQLGNYRLVRLLGQGGFAKVYLGEHVHLNTQAAIKVLQILLADQGMEQFRNEARTIANLKHPNSVRVLDFGVEEGVPFLVMECAANGTLRHRHPHGTKLSPEIVLPYVKPVWSLLLQIRAHNRRKRWLVPFLTWLLSRSKANLDQPAINMHWELWSMNG